MKAPQFSSPIRDASSISEDSKPIVRLREESTSSLLKRITEATDKRRQMRKKSRCSNLLAEAVLSNVIRLAKSDLARRQEEKRRKLKTFSYHLSLSSQVYQSESSGTEYQSESSDAVYLCKAQAQSNQLEDQLKSCIQSLDSFFEGLNQIKV